MKKFIISLLLFSSISLQAFAYENFLLISDKNISNVDVKDANIVTVVPMTTLSNDKKSAIITSLKVGETEFSFNNGKKFIKCNVKVGADKTIISKTSGVKFIPIDLPTELRK